VYISQLVRKIVKGREKIITNCKTAGAWKETAWTSTRYTEEKHETLQSGQAANVAAFNRPLSST
jgi:hypothetical protein